MLVCPHCRNENAEEAQSCAHCGKSLAPGDSALARVPRREVQETELDMPTPRQPNPVPALVGLAVMALALGGLATWLALRPNPCEGKFSSDTYPYCLVLPRGWTLETQGQGETTADSFRPTDRSAVVFVAAEQVEGEADARRYAERYRRRQEQIGVFPGPAQDIHVAGERGLAWEFTATNAEGVDYRQRQMAVIHEGTAFVITFAGADASYDETRLAFEDMLDTWTWR